MQEHPHLMNLFQLLSEDMKEEEVIIIKKKGEVYRNLIKNPLLLMKV